MSLAFVGNPEDRGLNSCCYTLCMHNTLLEMKRAMCAIDTT